MVIGVGVSTYNRPEGLARLCRGLSVLPCRVLVMDDGGSSDLSGSVPSGPQFSLERCPNAGIATNRNRLLHGLFLRPDVDVVMFLDDDMEVCSPRFLDAWAAAARRHGVVAWRCDQHGAICMPTGSAGGSAVAITRAAFERLGWFDARYDQGWGYEDSDWFRRWAALTGLPLRTMSWGMRHHGGLGTYCSPERLARNTALYARADAQPPAEHFHDDIHGWFDFQELYARVVREAPPGSRLIEVGVWRGKSLSHLAVEAGNSGKAVYLAGIDTWRGSDGDTAMLAVAAADDIKGEARRNLSRSRQPVVLLHKDSVEAAADFPDCSCYFVFIDACHAEYAVRQDIAAWLPKVARGGLLAGHDYDCESVARAVDALLPGREIDGPCWLWRVTV